MRALSHLLWAVSTIYKAVAGWLAVAGCRCWAATQLCYFQFQNKLVILLHGTLSNLLCKNKHHIMGSLVCSLWWPPFVPCAELKLAHACAPSLMLTLSLLLMLTMYYTLVCALQPSSSSRAGILVGNFINWWCLLRAKNGSLCYNHRGRKWTTTVSTAANEWVRQGAKWWSNYDYKRLAMRIWTCI